MKYINIERCGIIGIEQNIWNGFVFEFIYFNDRCLMGLSHGYKSYLTIDILFLQFSFDYK